MRFWKNRKSSKEEFVRIEEEDRQGLELEKREVSNLFDALSEKWKEKCMKLLADTQTNLMERKISQKYGGRDTAKLRRIVDIIMRWSPISKNVVASNLSTQYNIKQVFLEDLYEVAA